jgi:hypothetical protein
MSLEMAHKVIVPQKKNYVPQFLKQRDINTVVRGYGRLLFYLPQKLSNHMDRQVRTGYTVLVKSSKRPNPKSLTRG